MRGCFRASRFFWVSYENQTLCIKKLSHLCSKKSRKNRRLTWQVELWDVCVATLQLQPVVMLYWMSSLRCFLNILAALHFLHLACVSVVLSSPCRLTQWWAPESDGWHTEKNHGNHVSSWPSLNLFWCLLTFIMLAVVNIFSCCSWNTCLVSSYDENHFWLLCQSREICDWYLFI